MYTQQGEREREREGGRTSACLGRWAGLGWAGRAGAVLDRSIELGGSAGVAELRLRGRGPGQQVCIQSNRKDGWDTANALHRHLGLVATISPISSPSPLFLLLLPLTLHTSPFLLFA